MNFNDGTIWRPNWGKKDDKVQSKAISDSSKPKESVDKGKAIVNQECTKDIKCLKCLGWGHIASQCPNKRTILMCDGTYESRDEDMIWMRCLS